MDGPGLEPWWRQQIFSSSYPFIPTLGPTQPPLQWVLELLSKRKATRAWS